MPKPKSEKRYIMHITVTPERPMASFPVDMLRYDSCIPASEADAHEIEASISGARMGKPINLVRVSRTDALPSEGRWASFGWKVSENNNVTP